MKLFLTPSQRAELNAAHNARQAFQELQEAIGDDASRAVKCLAKDLESLLVHYRFDRKWLGGPQDN